MKAVERLIAARSGSPSSTTEAQRMQHEAALIERFLNESSSQLTWTGLTELHRDLAEGEASRTISDVFHVCSQASQWPCLETIILQLL